MTLDPFTMELRLCDDEGIVGSTRIADGSSPSGWTYLDRHNHLVTRGILGAEAPVKEPFYCTGSAHFACGHVRCTSPAHAAARQRLAAQRIVATGGESVASLGDQDALTET
jgi:hypothetical protein